MIMKEFIKASLLGLASASVLFAASEAKATTLTYTDTFPASTTEWSHNFSLPLFDPALGTLQSVYVQADENLTMSGTVQNHATGPESVSIRTGSLLTVTLPGSLGFLQPAPLASAQLYNLSAGGSAPYGPVSASDSVNYTYTAPADMASFVGTGSFTLPAFTQTQLRISGGGGNINVVLTTLAGADVEVQYVYQPNSEPVPDCGATGWLLSMTMVLVGALERKLRK